MILSRQYGYYGNNCDYYGNCHSAWYRFGRWILAGVLIFLAILFAVVFMCIRNRRRRRLYTAGGATPMTYQTPLAPQPQAGYYNENQYPNQGYNQNYAAPQGPPPQYGGEMYGQRGDVEMPGTTYQPGRK